MEVKEDLPVEITSYTTRKGKTVQVEGFKFIGDPQGGNLSGHGKATGEAFWKVSILLGDYLCWDCPLLVRPYAPPRKVCDLGCGLGLAGLVAATLLDPGDSVHLTDGDAAVVNRARVSIEANDTPSTVQASVLLWGDEAAQTELNRETVGTFDLCLASDVIYDPELAKGRAETLAKCVDALLKPEDPQELPLWHQTHESDWHSWIDCTVPVPVDGQRCRPMCVVAFHRRNVSLDVLTDAFENAGFEYHIPESLESDGYVEDIFAGRTEDLTDLWESVILCFTRARGIPSKNPASVTENEIANGEAD